MKKSIVDRLITLAFAALMALGLLAWLVHFAYALVFDLARARKLIVSLDQVANTALGGEPDETLSSRAYRTALRRKPLGLFFRPLIDALFFFEPGHCKDAYFAERERAQLPPEFRKSLKDGQ